MKNFGVMTLPKPLSRSTLYSAMKLPLRHVQGFALWTGKNRSLSSKWMIFGLSTAQNGLSLKTWHDGRTGSPVH